MRYTKLLYWTVLEKATWLIMTWLMLLKKNISCLYWKEKMYPLKRSMSTDVIKMLRAMHQFNVWFHCHVCIHFFICIWNGHIMCLFYLICCLSSLLDRYFVLIGPQNYSWLEKNGFFLPHKCFLQLPPALLKICKSCKSCSTKGLCVCVCVCVCVCLELFGSCTIVVVVQNVKILTTFCLNDSCFKSNHLLFAHIPSPWWSWTILTLFCTEKSSQDFTCIDLLVSLLLWNGQEGTDIM